MHFSNPITEYNTDSANKHKNDDKNNEFFNSDAIKTISILKKFEGNTDIRTNGSILSDIIEANVNNNMQCGDHIESVQQNCSQLLWTPESKRWNARFEYLSECETEKLKEIGSLQPEFPLVYFNDVEKHLFVGNG